MWVAGVLLVTLGIAATWWGLFGDRSRGRRRCPRCWHDLSHTPGMRCSECGHIAKKERAFFRTHRRLVPAVAGVAAATVAATYGLEHLQTQGVISTLPTRVILLTMPLVGEHHHALSGELASRIGRKKLTEGHFRALVKRCLKGDRSARPISHSSRNRATGRWSRSTTAIGTRLALSSAQSAAPVTQRACW